MPLRDVGGGGIRRTEPLIPNLGARWGWVAKFTSGKEPRELPNMRQTWPKNLSGRFGQQKNLLSIPRLEPRTVKPLSQSLYRQQHTGSMQWDLQNAKSPQRIVSGMEWQSTVCWQHGNWVGREKVGPDEALQPHWKERATRSSRLLSQTLQWKQHRAKGHALR
jgi:hypothetical protein